MVDHVVKKNYEFKNVIVEVLTITLMNGNRKIYGYTHPKNKRSLISSALKVHY